MAFASKIMKWETKWFDLSNDSIPVGCGLPEKVWCVLGDEEVGGPEIVSSSTGATKSLQVENHILNETEGQMM